MKRMISVSIRVAAMMLALGVCVAPPAPASAASKDSCVDCHSDKKWLVQNKKLYDYYQNWQISVHAEEGITCTDCHGGNPSASDKTTAHAGKAMGGSGTSSAVNFRNIPKLCAECHKDIYEGYSTSPHAKHLVVKAGEQQGPSCVTCHGSVNATALNVTTVREVCQNCHNPKTNNHPEIPERAAYILSRFLSINRLYRYVSLKGNPEDTAKFFKTIDPIRGDLAKEWHTFNLDKVEGKTTLLLDELKKERNEVREDRHK